MASRTFQAEDEIAAVCAAIGAAFAGDFAMSGTSGPGLALKSEAIGLAVIYELPMVIVDVQRAGPATGMPTKTEQADLLQAFFGRPSESPCVIVAPRSPSDCFDMAIEAFRLAVHCMCPVIYLSDGYIANGAEPWRIPDLDVDPADQGRAPDARRTTRTVPTFRICATRRHSHGRGRFPAHLDSNTGSAVWRSRTSPAMSRTTPTITTTWFGCGRRRCERAAEIIPPLEVRGPQSGDTLLLGWGGTYGSITTAAERLRESGYQVSNAHLRHLNPFPANLGQVLAGFKRIIIPEINLGSAAAAHSGPLSRRRDRHRPDARAGFPRRRPGERDGCDHGGRGRPTGVTNARGGEAMSAESTSTSLPTYSAKDFSTDQDVRWCPGCGDYAVLTAVRKALPRMQRRKEDFVFVSGIGCAARFPYYVDTYGLHSIHGRAPSFATGIKLANPELEVWLVSGDGDLLSIGANHTVHTMRRNVDINIILLNNRIYGLTKGQYSPTSELGKVTKSTPMGSPDYPLNPISLALGAGCTFIARCLDVDVKPLDGLMQEAAAHRGTTFIEVYQDCNIFNHQTWFYASQKESRPETTVQVEHGKPLIFGEKNDKGIRLNGTSLEVVALGNGVSEDDLLVHDETNRNVAFMLSQMHQPTLPEPMGILYRDRTEQSYEFLVHDQVRRAIEKRGEGNLAELLAEGETWTVGEDGREKA